MLSGRGSRGLARAHAQVRAVAPRPPRCDAARPFVRVSERRFRNCWQNRSVHRQPACRSLLRGNYRAAQCYNTRFPGARHSNNQCLLHLTSKWELSHKLRSTRLGGRHCTAIVLPSGKAWQDSAKHAVRLRRAPNLQGSKRSENHSQPQERHDVVRRRGRLLLHGNIKEVAHAHAAQLRVPALLRLLREHRLHKRRAGTWVGGQRAVWARTLTLTNSVPGGVAMLYAISIQWKPLSLRCTFLTVGVSFWYLTLSVGRKGGRTGSVFAQSRATLAGPATHPTKQRT